ncbi:MAG: hypothetical protein UV10_C0033G0001, partial [Candidatus Azambacteria bacterium GW2011_GWA1_42_19]
SFLVPGIKCGFHYSPILLYFLAFEIAAVGTGLVGAGRLVTIGAGNQFRENQTMSRPAGALASS